MPLWCDATLYQTAAQSVLSGGVHYRDTFDTNPPGFVWAMCAVYTLIGSESESLRIADLLVSCGAMIALLRLASIAGARRVDLVWAMAGWASFYPYLAEFCHLQRDVWMMLPALIAVLVRIRRFTHFLIDEHVSLSFSSALVEGLLWATACWFKPHIIIPAFFVWLTTMVMIFRCCSAPFRQAIRDILGVVLGAGMVLMAGIIWLVRTGAWDA